MKSQPVLLIHGGAGGKVASRERHAILTASLERILTEVYPRLEKGESALKTVTFAVSLLENDPLYNAGKGSKIQSDGHIRMSAAVMDGERRRFAGCVNVEGVKNPIRLAEALLKRQDRVLSGEGARRFAKDLGLAFASPFTDAQVKKFVARKGGKSGTVGAVALDSKGRLAAATSTGGRGFEYPYRVSDSPTTAGNFANSLCAVSSTGRGEEIVEFSAASTICAYMETGLTLAKAVKRLFTQAKRRHVEFGVIALDSKGHFTATTTTDSLLWGAASPKGFEFMP